MVFDVLYDSAATSRIFQLRGPFMVEGVYEPADGPGFDVCQGPGRDLAPSPTHCPCPTPLLAAIRPIYAAAMAQGMADLDGAAVHAVLEQMAGIERETRGD